MRSALFFDRPRDRGVAQADACSRTEGHAAAQQQAAALNRCRQIRRRPSPCTQGER